MTKISYNPRKVMVAIPTHNGQIFAECAGGIAQCVAAQRFGNFYFHVQGSCINHIRNQIAGIFLRSEFDTLVCIDADIGFTCQDFDFLMEGEEIIATAEYCRKMMEYSPVTFGMGFVRIHRSVFAKLDNLMDDEGKPLVGTYYEDGHIERDYFRTGASSDSKWMAEDFGFWSLVHLSGIKPKVEKRTTLKHWGMHAYVYRHDTEFGAQ